MKTQNSSNLYENYKSPTTAYINTIPYRRREKTKNVVKEKKRKISNKFRKMRQKNTPKIM